MSINQEEIGRVRIEGVSYWPFKSFKKSQGNTSYRAKLDKIKRGVRNLRNYIGSIFDIHDIWIIPAILRVLNIYKE